MSNQRNQVTSALTVGLRESFHVPNTMALPCEAGTVLEYREPSQLPGLQALFDSHGPLLVLGGASNVILPARLNQALVLMRSQGIALAAQTDTHWLVEVAAGQNWHEWVKTSLARGWPGLENLALIPGTVGAAPVQNIGAYGVELCERLDGVQIWDFQRRASRWLSVDECRFGYRDSVFKANEGKQWLVLAVRFALPRAWQPVLDYPDLQVLAAQGVANVTPEAVFERVVAVRTEKLPDPAVKPNVGSFFKNPVVSHAHALRLRGQFPALVGYEQPDGRVKLAAGWLIDQCGFKGKRLGPVAVHERQALVLVNEGGATATDVMAMARDIVVEVKARFDVQLEVEPSIW